MGEATTIVVGCRFRLRVRLRLHSLEEVEGWVLRFGTHATVIRPPALAERIGTVGRELAQRCGAQWREKFSSF
jgi:hypothetical protein